MIKFLLIDDDKEFLNQLEKMVRAQSQLLKYECCIDAVDDIKNIEDKRYDFVFLDIDFGNSENGFVIANKIKNKNKDIKIIFATSHEHLMHDSLVIQPFYFIRKKNINNDIAIAFSLIKEYFSKKEVFIYKDNGRTKSIYVDDIVYIKTSDHVTSVYMLDHQEHVFYKTLNKLEESINCNHICRIHKKYSIHMKNIMYVEGGSIRMINGEMLSIGRTYKRKFLEKYKKYVSREDC